MPGFLNRLLGRIRGDENEREIEQHRGSAEDRKVASESVDDIAADEFVGEHLGGVDPGRLTDDEFRD
jgi:hypothetical protein